jgi:hypothetical protein
MKCRSKQILLPAFSLVEVVTALVILALISLSVLVVINRCMASAADSELRMQAFEVARDNMETLLSKDSVEEMVEYGSSVRYPEIKWQTTVEVFYEPVASEQMQMWVRGICLAEYTDSAGEVQTIELAHWLTGLTKEQLLEIIKEKQREEERLAEELIETVEDAADYAGVDVATIQQWVENGMPQTEDGFYIKDWLDLYARTDGKPTIEDRSRLAKEDMGEEIEEGKPDEKGEEKENDGESGEGETEEEREEEREEETKEETKRDEAKEELICGYTEEELMQMSFEQMWEILINCDKF